MSTRRWRPGGRAARRVARLSPLQLPRRPDRDADGCGVAAEEGLHLHVLLVARRDTEGLRVVCHEPLTIPEGRADQELPWIDQTRDQPVVDVPGRTRCRALALAARQRAGVGVDLLGR